MKYGKYVGRIAGGKDVYIGNGSPNRHLLISGISGSGKSVRIADIERHAIADGDTIIALDINGTHERLEDDICNYISAQEDGLNIKVLDTSLVEMGKESPMNLIQYAVETLAPRKMHGACQLAALRKAVKFALQHRAKYKTEMEAILAGLEAQEETAALGVYNHLCPILEGGIFRESEKAIQPGKLNIISLQSLNPKTQKQVTEIFLAALWRDKRSSRALIEDKVTLVLDEFQNLNFQKGSALFELLTEGRKYGLEIVMATQTLAIFSKKDLAIINQAAVKLFFQQSVTDLTGIAAMIEPQYKEKWIEKLAELQIGEAISVGNLEVAGKKINQPILTRSCFNETGLCTNNQT